MKTIGIYKGKEINEMTRDELIEFAKYALKRIEELEVIEKETQEDRIQKEVESFIIHNKYMRKNDLIQLLCALIFLAAAFIVTR